MRMERDDLFKLIDRTYKLRTNLAGSPEELMKVHLENIQWYTNYYKINGNRTVNRVAGAMFQFMPLPKRTKPAAPVYVDQFIKLKSDKEPYIYMMTDCFDDILYIGHSKNIYKRLTTHMHDKPWWNEVKEVYFERFEGMPVKEVNKLEQIYIRAVCPKYNKQQYNQKYIDGFPNLTLVEDVYKVMEDRMKSPGYKKRMKVGQKEA